MRIVSPHTVASTRAAHLITRLPGQPAFDHRREVKDAQYMAASRRYAGAGWRFSCLLVVLLR